MANIAKGFPYRFYYKYYVLITMTMSNQKVVSLHNLAPCGFNDSMQSIDHMKKQMTKALHHEDALPLNVFHLALQFSHCDIEASIHPHSLSETW